MKHSRAFLLLVAAAKRRIPEVTVSGVKRNLRERHPFLLIDVREDREWDAGHITGALHLGRGILERDIENAVPDKHAEIVLYCGGGYRSALAAESLGRMGYRNVSSMAGGWKAWRRARGSVTKGR
jgi:rhodanese-related sulfurtransferase